MHKGGGIIVDCGVPKRKNLPPCGSAKPNSPQGSPGALARETGGSRPSDKAAASCQSSSQCAPQHWPGHRSCGISRRHQGQTNNDRHGEIRRQACKRRQSRGLISRGAAATYKEMVVLAGNHTCCMQGDCLQLLFSSPESILVGLPALSPAVSESAVRVQLGNFSPNGSKGNE